MDEQDIKTQGGQSPAKPHRAGLWLVLGLLALAALYVGLQLYTVLHRPYTTQSAVEATMEDTIACRGIMGRSETDVPYEGGGVLSYVAEDGARVMQGGVVAQLFTDNTAAEQSAYAKSLQQQIAALEKSQASTTGTDVEMLLRQTYTGMYAMLNTIESGDYRNLEAEKSAVQVAKNKLLGATGSGGDYSAQIATLTEQYNAAVAGSVGAEILAPRTGYFVAAQDSTKRLYTAQQLSEMTPQALYDAANETPPPCDAGIAGKIIEDYRWKFFTSLTLKEASKLYEGAEVSLRFPDVSEENLPAVVTAITEDEASGRASVELSCEYLTPDVVTLEHANALVSVASYTGLRIDKRALRIVDGVKGVYIRYGNVVYFKPISILYEDDSFLLVSSEYVVKTNEVQLYDEVVLGGADLADGKIL